jgi:hypothetical protein
MAYLVMISVKATLDLKVKVMALREVYRQHVNNRSQNQILRLKQTIITDDKNFILP